jgi:hypothetical protein
MNRLNHLKAVNLKQHNFDVFNDEYSNFSHSSSLRSINLNNESIQSKVGRQTIVVSKPQNQILNAGAIIERAGVKEVLMELTCKQCNAIN